MATREFTGIRPEEALSAGQEALESGRFEEAAAFFRSALRVDRLSANEEAIVRCHLSEALEKRGLNREQLDTVAKYENFARFARLPESTQLLVLIRLGWAHSLNNDIPRAVAYFNQGMRIARRLDDPAGIGGCYFGLGRAYRVVSEIRIARDHYISALEHYRRVGNWRELAESYINIGYVNAREGDYKNALHAIKQALTIIGDREEHDLLGRAYMYLGVTYDNMEATTRGITAYEKCIDHFRLAGNKLYLAINQNNYAVILIWLGNWSRAEHLTKESIEVLKTTSSVAVLGAAYDTLAQIYLLQGRLDDVDRHLQKSLQTLSSIKTGKWNESMAYLTMGRSFLVRGEPDLAVTPFKQAVEAGIRLGDQQHLVPDARLWLAEAYLQLGELALARQEVDSVRAYLRQGPNLKTWGLMARVAGKLEAAEGHRAAAIQWIAQSSSIYQIRGNVYARAVNRIVLARILEMQDRLHEAISQVEAAQPVFALLGATIDDKNAIDYLDLLRQESAEAKLIGTPAKNDTERHIAVRGDLPDLVSGIDGFTARRIVEASVSRELMLYEVASMIHEQASGRAVVIAEVEEGDILAGPPTSLRIVACIGLDEHEQEKDIALLGALSPQKYQAQGVHVLSDNIQTTFLIHIIEPRSERYRSGTHTLQPLLGLVELGLEAQMLRGKNRRAKVFDTGRLLAEVEMPGFICASRATSRVLEQIHKIRSSDVTVLITGESGTGKELIARAIHADSSRRYSTFLPFNCSSSPREMIESQLFGYRKGAFTGAIANYEGVIRAAAGGTLFLDEIGDLPFDLQPKLLRFLQEGEVHPMGESQPLHVDVRVIAATNADLERAVSEASFREDLFHRLNVIRIHVPPLRERREEIPHLINHYFNLYQREAAKTELKLAEETVDLMVVYQWPGNVRQLCNEIRRIVTYTESGSIIGPDALSAEIVRASRKIGFSKSGRSGPLKPFSVTTTGTKLADAINNLERHMIEDALRRCSGNIAQAAKELGLSRKGLYLKMSRLNFKP